MRVDCMLISTFLTQIFFSSTYPFIHKAIMSAVSDSILAVNQIINCISIVVFGSVWNKYSDKIFVAYPAICIAETLLSIVSTIFAVATHNLVAYYILDTLIFSVVTRNICCGAVKLKSIRYNTESDREKFDNNNNSASAVATIIGSCIAIVLHLDMDVMLWIATIGNAIDNVFYIVIYKKTQRRRHV